MNDICFFVFNKWPPNLVNVVLHYSSFDTDIKLWKLFNNSFPLNFSESKTAALFMCLIDEYLSFVKTHVKSSNNCLLGKKQSKSLSFVYFIPYFVFSFFNKCYFVNFVKLSVENYIAITVEWFKSLHNFDNKFEIIWILESEHSMLNFDCWLLIWLKSNFILFNLEVIFEVVKEVFIQVFGIKISFNFDWHLSEKISIFIRSDGHVLVCWPLIFEIVFDFIEELWFHWLAIVETLD